MRGVKECITSNATWPAIRSHPSSTRPTSRWYGQKQASARASTSALVIPRFAGTGVPSLTSGVEPSPPGQRLQSITSRE